MRRGFIEESYSVGFIDFMIPLHVSLNFQSCEDKLHPSPRFVPFFFCAVSLQLPMGNSHQGCHEEVPESNEP